MLYSLECGAVAEAEMMVVIEDQRICKGDGDVSKAEKRRSQDQATNQSEGQGEK